MHVKSDAGTGKIVAGKKKVGEIKNLVDFLVENVYSIVGLEVEKYF